MISWQRKHRWFALLLSPVVLVAAVVSPCATCCSFAKPADEEHTCCHKVERRIESPVTGTNAHSCCQTKSAQSPTAGEQDGCKCSLSSRPAWVASKASERDLASPHDFVLAATIDWSASAELAATTGRAFDIARDESPHPTVPLRVLFCSWLI